MLLLIMMGQKYSCTSGPVVVTLKSQLGYFEKKIGHTQRTSRDRAILAERNWRSSGGHRCCGRCEGC